MVANVPSGSLNTSNCDSGSSKSTSTRSRSSGSSNARGFSGSFSWRQAGQRLVWVNIWLKQRRWNSVSQHSVLLRRWRTSTEKSPWQIKHKPRSVSSGCNSCKRLLRLTAVISHTRPRTIFSQFKNYIFGGRQSNVSMTITANGVTGTTISILWVSELLFQLYLTRR